MAESSVLNALVTVSFGALAGGLTNAVAIWMLFHPYESRGVGRLRLQGAIPKNKERLARTIGRTVGQRLITPDDLAEHLSSPKLQEAFDRALGSAISGVLEQERGSLREELPRPLLTEIQATFDTLAPAVAEKIHSFSQSEDFRRAVADFIEQARGHLSDRTIGEILTKDRRKALREAADGWVAEVVSNPEFEDAIGGWLDRQIVRMANDHTPLLDRLPEALVAAVERAIAGYLPEALERLGNALSNDDTRGRIQAALHDQFQRFANDLLLHERIVAKLVVTEKTISRMLDTFERNGADKITELLEHPEMKEEIARSVTGAISSFLKWPMSHHVDHLGHERVNSLKESAQENIVLALRDANTRAYAIDKLDETIRNFENKTWGEILGHLPPDKAAELASEAAASPRVRSWIQDALRGAFDSILDRPLGKPANWLDENTIGGVRNRLSPALWQWTQTQVPKLVEQIDVESMVEEKVLGFSLQRIEELVRRTTQRELDVIVRLGYVLGAIIGAGAYGISLILP